jgi:RNA 2',3'-cyclic 3'-phosphodiesterase
VAKERLKSPRARLFVALDLPDEVRDGLAAWQAVELADEALRPIPREALHITLCFLGYLPEREIDRIGALLLAVPARPIPLRLAAEPVAKPPRRPRLFAIDAPSEGAIAIQAEVEAALVAERLYKPEKRPFWPHVTVARVRPVKGRKGKPRRVTRSPGALPDALLEPFGAVRVTLYRSILRPAGAEYTPLASLALPQRAE